MSKTMEDLDAQIQALGNQLRAVPEWHEFELESYGCMASDLIRKAKTAKQIDDVLKLDTQFTDKKWGEFDSEQLRTRYSEIADYMMRFYREREQTRMYMSATVNPNISAETLHDVLKKTALTHNDVDRADVISGAFRNPKLKPEHYDALIDCFKDGADIINYHGEDVLELKDLSVSQLKRFEKIVKEAAKKHSKGRFAEVLGQIGQKKLELRDKERKLEIYRKYDSMDEKVCYAVERLEKLGVKPYVKSFTGNGTCFDFFKDAAEQATRKNHKVAIFLTSGEIKGLFVISPDKNVGDEEYMKGKYKDYVDNQKRLRWDKPIEQQKAEEKAMSDKIVSKSKK